MNSKIWRGIAFTLVILLAALLTACEWGLSSSASGDKTDTNSDQGNDQPAEQNEPELAISQGYIVDKADGTVIVTAYKVNGENAYVDAYSLRINEQTKMTTTMAQAVSFDELKIGMEVEVWTKGPVAESYPMQAAAAKIIISLDQSNEKVSQEEAVRAAIEAQTELAGPWAVKDAILRKDLQAWEIELVHHMYTDQPVPVLVDSESGELRPYVVTENDWFRITSPLPHTKVGPTFTVEGEARVFEAAFSWILEDGHSVLAEGHEMASAGAPEWGTFSFEVNFERASQPNVMLVLFVHSANDGSQEHELVIPLTVQEDLIQYSADLMQVK
jgi:outer membrane lipopolysaccharide assembly protein LptE/RlpB